MNRDAKWMDLFEQVSADRDRARQAGDANVLAILLGEEATVFGKRARFTVEWPDGYPLGGEAKFKAWAAEQLETIRARQRGDAA